MGTTIWTNGNSDGDLDNAANWSGIVPVNDDIAVFNPTQTASGTVNGDNFIAVDLDHLIINPGYTGDIGTSGEYFTVSADKVTHRGGGTLYYSDGNGSTDAFYVDSGNNTLAAQLTGDTITLLAVLNGAVTCTSGLSNVVNLFVGYGAKVKLEGSNAITNVYMVGGTVTSTVPITSARIWGGSLTQHESGGAFATLEMGGDAKVTYNGTGTIGTAIVGGKSVLDMSQDSRAKIISVARVFPTARLIPGDNLTITAGGTLRPWEVID